MIHDLLTMFSMTMAMLGVHYFETYIAKFRLPKLTTKQYVSMFEIVELIILFLMFMYWYAITAYEMVLAGSASQ